MDDTMDRRNISDPALEQKICRKERNYRLVCSPTVLSDPISDPDDLCQRNSRRYGIITASDRGEKG